MWLLLAALAMLFVASLLGYVLISVAQRQPQPVMRDGQIVYVDRQVPPIKLPHLLWLSTAVMILSSVTVHRALDAVQRERQLWFRRWILLTLALAIAFIVVQAPSLYLMINQHFASLPARPSIDEPASAQLGLIVALIVIHALHVLGGVIPLAIVARRSHAGRYDHESHGPVKYIAMYWHFLDIVWLVMFAVLLLTARGSG